MNDTNEYFFPIVYSKNTSYVNDWPFRINDSIKVQLIVRLNQDCIIVCPQNTIDCHTMQLIFCWC